MHLELDSLRIGHTDVAAGRASLRARPTDASALVSLRECSLVLDGRLCLNRVDLQIARGECVAVLGPGKAGKSVLLECIEGLHTPCSGRAEVWGIDAHRLQRIHREEIGALRPRATLPSMLRVGQLLELASVAAAETRDEDTEPHALRMRFGLDAFARLRVEQLADPDLAALAAWMALCRPRRLLLLDEPGAGLDSTRQRVLWQAVEAQRHRHGCAVVLASRRTELARRCDRVLHLAAGRVTSAGTALAAAAPLARHLSLVNVRPGSGACVHPAWPGAIKALRGGATAPDLQLDCNDRERALP